ncbi:MAG: DNA-processing protein DprA [Deltaproteobacteria bacterium]|nr:DNA-processing protein DprA [Deltaproteobacteria bacterium]
MNVSQDDRVSWLALYLIPGLGNAVLKRLIQAFGDPGTIFEAGLAELMQIEGMRKDLAEKITGRALDREAEKEIRRSEQVNAKIIVYTDPSYPPSLREIHNPPMVLFVRGKDIPPNKTFVGVVGSRNSTHYGRSAAEKIAMGLARRGAGVVSGLARGIDAAAHNGCLLGEGFTVGVLGTGIDVIYPESNKALFRRIEEKGAIVSEFPTGTPPEPRNFPIRNRIISGLSRGTAVVEATRRSGSLITASLALEQGRDVFAVPGSIDSFKSTGSHFLIKQGAKLIENADDILAELGFMGRGPSKGSGVKNPDAKPRAMDEVEERVYGIIGDYPIHMDDIARQANMEAGRVAGVLMKLELEGMVRQLAGRMFVR